MRVQCKSDAKYKNNLNSKLNMITILHFCIHQTSEFCFSRALINCSNSENPPLFRARMSEHRHKHARLSKAWNKIKHKHNTTTQRKRQRITKCAVRWKKLTSAFLRLFLCFLKFICLCLILFYECEPGLMKQVSVFLFIKKFKVSSFFFSFYSLFWRMLTQLFSLLSVSSKYIHLVAR